MNTDASTLTTKHRFSTNTNNYFTTKYCRQSKPITCRYDHDGVLVLRDQQLNVQTKHNGQQKEILKITVEEILKLQSHQQKPQQ